MKYQGIKNCFCSTILLSCMTVLLTACLDNKLLATYDLGQNRVIKIRTGESDNYIPIFAEFYQDGKLVRKCHIQAVEYDQVEQIRFDPVPITDKSKQVFLIRSQSEYIGTDAVDTEAAVDYTSNFMFPCDHGTTESATGLNKIYEKLEANNPNMKFNRIKIP